MLLVGALAVLGTAVGGAAALVRVEHPPGHFSHLRVCAYPAFSLAEKRCTRDQRTRTLVSSKFACSVDLRADRPQRLQARMTYEGTPVYGYTTRVLARDSWSLWISENVGSTPLPGGRWRCDYSFGSARAGVAFRSGGPRGEVIGASVCDAKDSLFYAHHKIRVCKADESPRPIRATRLILCSAVFVKVEGKTGEVQLLAGGTDAAKPDIEKIPAPLSISWTPFAPAAPAADGTFPAGDYVCRFSVDGAAVVEKLFRVVSG
jgi:hypothetical protein